MQRTDPLPAATHDAKPARGANPARGASSGVRRRGPRGPFNIADSYLLRQVVEGTLRGLLWFGGLLAVFAVLSALRKAADQSIAAGPALQLIVYQMPRILLFALPMSVLFGTVQTFSELSGKGEIIALWAGGMSLKRMLRAPLAWGAALALVAFVVQEAIVPGAETRRNEVLARQARVMLGAQENFSLRDPARGPLRKVIQAQRFDPATNTLIRPSIQLYRDLDVYLKITAERGEWNEATGKWKLIRGHSVLFPSGANRSNGASIESSFDETEKFDVPAPGSLRKDSMTRSDNLARGNFEMVSIAELLAYRQQLGAQLAAPQDDLKTRKLMSGATYGIHDKIATPLICLALILVGAPLGLRPQRASAGFAPGMSLLVLLLYYVVWSGTSYSGKEGSLNPLLMAYLAPALTVLVGLALVWKKNR